VRHTAALIAALALGAGVGVGCGSSSKSSNPIAVITVTKTQTTPAGSTSTTTSTTTATTSSTSTQTQTGDSGGVTAPESANGVGNPMSLDQATALIRKKGWTPTVTFGYSPKRTLSVILASKSTYVMQAFFFVNGKYIGTDTSDPSAAISLNSQDDTSATLSYSVYDPGTPLKSPDALIPVRFVLDNGKLVPADTIPDSDPKLPVSRR
jgi:hypothetical protein